MTGGMRISDIKMFKLDIFRHNITVEYIIPFTITPPYTVLNVQDSSFVFQFWFLEKCPPAGRLVESLLLILGQAVPGEGVVDRGDNSAVRVDSRCGASALLYLTSTVRAQDPS